MATSIQRIQMIEINIPNGSTLTQFSFPDQPQLTGNAGLPVVIDSITTYTSDTLQKSPLTFGNVLISADIQNSFLTLYQGDLATINACPLVDLVQTASIVSPTYGANGVINRPIFRNLINVSWTKSFVRFGTAPSTTNVNIVFKVCYTVFNNQTDLDNYLLNQF